MDLSSGRINGDHARACVRVTKQRLEAWPSDLWRLPRAHFTQCKHWGIEKGFAASVNR